MPVGIFPVGVFPAPVGSPRVTFACGVATAAVVSASVSDLPALRERPGEPPAAPIPPRFLRHADEQTVVGVAAVLRACASPVLAGETFAEWGVVAAPVFPGRIGGAGTFTKYREDGAAVVSPHIIPQYSLHSLAGAVSICLGVHGPNFGIGGGWQALPEALTVALSLLDQGTLPGLWLVLTQWCPEPIPDSRGSTQSDAACVGTALALRPAPYAGATLRLTMPGRARSAMHHPAPASGARDVPTAGRSEPYLQLTRALAADLTAWSAAAWSLELPWGGRVELVPAENQQQMKAA